jgi:hypothetical protein
VENKQEVQNIKVKYAYQEFPQSEDTTSPHSQEEEKESMVNKMINFKTDTTNN